MADYKIENKYGEKLEVEIISTDGSTTIGYIDGDPAQWYGNSECPDLDEDDTIIYRHVYYDQASWCGPYGEEWRISESGKWVKNEEEDHTEAEEDE